MPEEATPSAPQPSTSAQVSQNTCTVLTLLAVYHRRHANSGLKDIGASDGVTCSSSVCNLLPCLAVKSVPPHPRGGAEAQQLTPTHGCTTGGGPGEGGGSCSGAHGGYTDSTAAVHQRSGMQPEPCAALGCLRQLVCGPVVHRVSFYHHAPLALPRSALLTCARCGYVRTHPATHCLTAMRKLRIVTVGISSGRSLTRPFRDAR